VLLAAVGDDTRREPVAGGYRVVLRDRAFRNLAGVNVAMIAVGWGVLPWVIPPYAEQELGLSPRLIGLMLLVNAATVVAAQVPIARLAEGRRRVRLMALAGVTFAGALALVAAGAGYGALLVAAAAIAIGECLHTTALTPLVADLAPPAVRGRYMAALGLSWWIGLALAPTLGTPLLTLSPAAALLVPAAIGLATAASALSLEPRLPDGARRTPRPVAATAPLAPR
jgi:MFS family permease